MVYSVELIQLQQVANPAINLLDAPPGSVSRLRVLQSRDKRRSRYGVDAGWRYRESTTGLSKAIHPPAIVRGVQVNRCENTLVELTPNRSGEDHFSRLPPNRRFEPMRQYTNELLFDGATAFTPSTHGATPQGACRGAEVDSEVATTSMILA